MLRNEQKFNQTCKSNLDSIRNPQRLPKKKREFMSCINNPLTQEFTNLRLASTISSGRSAFYLQLEKLKKDYQVRTGYIRINDKEIMEELYEVNMQNMKKKYQKYASFEKMNIPKPMIAVFQSFGYQQVSKFQQMAMAHLLFEYRSLLQYDNQWERDAIIALAAIAFLKQDCLNPQVLIVSPDDELGISINVLLGYLNINFNSIYLVSNRNKIVDDRKYLREAQIVVGTPERLEYVIKQKYLNTIFLESVVFQEFSLTSDLGFCNHVSSIMHMLPKKTSRHFFFSQTFSEAEHQILDI